LIANAFDQAYFERFYFNRRTRIAEPAYFDRLAAFAGAYLKLLDIPVGRVLDVGCGAGLLHRGLRRAFKGVKIDACDVSEYVCARFGWQCVSIEELEVKRSYDLVVCHDVLQYLDDKAASRALTKLAALTHCALLFGVLTREDWESNCDQDLTDRNAHMRGTAWYRRRLGAHFHNVGGGLYIKRDANVVLYSLESL
jgi:2-polyprenyl-3-methyl-5-hydroxy-6-metoxy-1,4-benzoquinol methylase